jgi:hypothetical protein
MKHVLPNNHSIPEPSDAPSLLAIRIPAAPSAVIITLRRSTRITRVNEQGII